MEIYGVSLIGHRRIEEFPRLQDRLLELVLRLLREKEYVEFYIGRDGDFDILAAAVIKQAQKMFGSHNSSLILVLPYPKKDEAYYRVYYDDVWRPLSSTTHFKAVITKRNQWMIEQSKLLIACVRHPHGGAYNALQYAEKREVPIVNLATIE